jgi:hypothetical protein
MDAMLLSAMSGLMGTLVGGSATVATAWVTQKKLSRRELVREEVRKREALYGEFIAECAKLLMDALTHALDKPEKLLPVYALLNRVRLTASPPVLRMAESLLTRITDQYFASNLTVDDLRAFARSDQADPLKSFGEVCRTELASIWADV